MSTGLVVAADVLLRSGLQSLLGEVPGIERTRSCGYDLRDGAHHADVAVVHLDGSAEAVLAVPLLAARVPVIAVGRDREGDDVLGRLGDGASAYVVQGDLDTAALHRAWLDVRAGVLHTSPGATTALGRQVRALAPGRPVEDLLSDREREIVALMAWGLSDEHIGVAVGIAVKTVRNHLQNIYARHDLHSRAEAIAWWRGLSGPSGPGRAPGRDIDLC